MAKISGDKHTRMLRKNREYVNMGHEEMAEKDECEETINISDACEIAGKRNASKVRIIDDDISNKHETGQMKEVNSETINMNDDFGSGSDEGNTQPEGPQDNFGNEVCV